MRRIAITIGVLAGTAALIGTGLVLAHERRDDAQPTPQAYAEIAVSKMSGGIRATPRLVREVHAEVARRTQSAKSYAETYEALTYAARQLGGEHSSFLPPTDAKRLLGTRDSRSTVTDATVDTQDGITTVSIPKLASSDRPVLKKWIGALDKQLMAAQRTTTRGWIVDLRGNTGGNIWPMLAGVSSLLSDGEVMGFKSAQHTDRVTISGNGVFLDGVVQARGSLSVPKSSLPVAVLVSGGTASSAEGVAIAFVGQHNSRSFGQQTAGLSTANTSIRLRDHAVINLTSAVDVDRTGRIYGTPVVPGMQSSEAAIDAAEWLKAYDKPSP